MPRADINCPTTNRKEGGDPLGGIQNVSRWMTWLPISVKNAAKCDKWYVLQNHPITESLNAKGAREKLLASDPRACRMLSVEKTKNRKRAALSLSGVGARVRFVVSRSCVSLVSTVGGAIRGSLAFPLECGKERKRPKTDHTTPSKAARISHSGLSSCAEKGGQTQKPQQQISE